MNLYIRACLSVNVRTRTPPVRKCWVTQRGAFRMNLRPQRVESLIYTPVRESKDEI